MVKQQGKKRQYLFLHGTCLLATLLFLINGCTVSTLNLKKEWQGRRCLDQAEQLINKGSYGDAIKAYDQVITLFPDSPPGDTALFYQGVLWAHPDHEQKNYKVGMHFTQPSTICRG